jgi:hypothetical protein
MHVLLLQAVVGEIFTSAGGGKSGNPIAAAGSIEKDDLSVKSCFFKIKCAALSN